MGSKRKRLRQFINNSVELIRQAKEYQKLSDEEKGLTDATESMMLLHNAKDYEKLVE